LQSLKEKSIIAVGWDLLGSFATQGVQFIISIILARLLSPSDFGLVGMAMVFIAISRTFIDLGFSSALIQNQKNTTLTYSSVFILNLSIGIILTLLFFSLAKPIGVFYENDTIEYLVLWLAPTLFFGALSMVQIAILKKELQFKELSIRLLIAGLLSGIIGVILALLGYGVYALAIQFLLNSIINTIVLWRVSKWRPQFNFSFGEIKKLLSFSTYTFLGQSLNQIINKLDALVIGKLFSPATLGFFTRAESLNSLIATYTSGSLSKVFFPAMSTLQDEPEQFRRIFLKVISIVSFLTFFLSGFFILSSEFLIITLFGEKWRPSVFIFNILMLKIFCYPISVIIVNSFKAIGKAKEDFWYGLFRKALRLLPFVFAFFYGFEAFLYTFVIISIVGTLFNNLIASLHLGIPFFTQTKEIYLFGVFFIIAVFIPFNYLYSVTCYELINLLIRNFLFASIFITLVIIFKNSIIIELLNRLKQVKEIILKK